MHLSELIHHVGDANVKFQPLAGSFVRGSVKKHDAEITFATERAIGQALVTEAATGAKADVIGLVVWLPRERLPERMR